MHDHICIHMSLAGCCCCCASPCWACCGAVPTAPMCMCQAICAFVEEHHPAALVIMRENKGAVTRFFMGSVSRYCAVHSAVPVIVVPA